MGRSRVDLLLHRLDHVYGKEDWDWFATMAAALKGVTAAEAAWRPGPGQNTIRQIVNHVAYWKDDVARRIRGVKGDGLDNDATFGEPGDPADEPGWRQALERLDRAHATLREALSGIDDDALVGEILRSVAGVIEHDAYHAGQIVFIRKARGSWPAAQA